MGDVNHIEIDNTAVEDLGKAWDDLLKKKDSVTESINDSLKDLHQMNGGLGNTQDAAEQLSLRRKQVDELAKLISQLPGIEMQHFIKNVENAEIKASLLSIEQERKFELQKNVFAALAGQMTEEKRKEFLSKIADDELRKDMEERISNAIYAQMMWDWERYRELKRRESEETGYRLAPKTYWEGVYRNVGDTWERWGTEGNWGVAKKVGLSAAAIVAVACAVYLSGGTALAGGAEAVSVKSSVLTSALIFGGVGGTVSAAATKIAGGSWEEAAINGMFGAVFGAMGGAGFGAGIALHSGSVVFISGAGTSALSSAVAAMRSGKDVDAELMAEIYTKAMMSGTFDLVLGKLFAFAEPKPITKSIGYTVDKSVAKYYAKTFRFDLDPAKVAEIAPKSYKIGDTRIGDEILMFPKAVPDSIKEMIKPQFGGVISNVRMNGPVSMTVGESFSVPVLWKESLTLAPEYRVLLSAKTLNTIWNNRGAALPSFGQMGARGILDENASGIFTDTFFIPDVKKQ